MRKLYVFCSTVIVPSLALTACQVREGETVTISGPTTTITVTEPAPTITETSWLIIDTYFDADEEIVTRVGKEFAIALYRNPRLGLKWDETYDEDMVVLLESTYKAYDGSLTGGEGKQWFVFKALNEGITEITLVYSHGFPGSDIEQKVFKVEIK